MIYAAFYPEDEKRPGPSITLHAFVKIGEDPPAEQLKELLDADYHKALETVKAVDPDDWNLDDVFNQLRKMGWFSQDCPLNVFTY